jgi:hypothetical protein
LRHFPPKLANWDSAIWYKWVASAKHITSSYEAESVYDVIENTLVSQYKTIKHFIVCRHQILIPSLPQLTRYLFDAVIKSFYIDEAWPE